MYKYEVPRTMYLYIVHVYSTCKYTWVHSTIYSYIPLRRNYGNTTRHTRCVDRCSAIVLCTYVQVPGTYVYRSKYGGIPEVEGRRGEGRLHGWSVCVYMCMLTQFTFFHLVLFSTGICIAPRTRSYEVGACTKYYVLVRRLLCTRTCTMYEVRTM